LPPAADDPVPSTARRPTAIILCAGSGRRFFADGASRPKTLLTIANTTGEQTLLDRLLRQVRGFGYGVVLGTGCGHDEVAARVAGLPDVTCAYNPDYATTNSITTLWRLRDWVADDTLLINGDLLVGDGVLARFRDVPEPQLLVKHLPEFDADTYRVTFDKSRRVTTMGKDLADPPGPFTAAFLGASRIGRAERFLAEIEALLEGGETQTWPTTAYKRMAPELPVRAVDIGDALFCDVDTPEEAAAARNLLRQSRKDGSGGPRAQGAAAV
jgi:choline kinase